MGPEPPGWWGKDHVDNAHHDGALVVRNVHGLESIWARWEIVDALATRQISYTWTGPFKSYCLIPIRPQRHGCIPDPCWSNECEYVRLRKSHNIDSAYNENTVRDKHTHTRTHITRVQHNRVHLVDDR